jgi:hypothetical protein
MGTSVAAFIGSVPGPPPVDPVLVTSVSDFERTFGTIEGETADALWLFFENGGRRAYVAAFDETYPLRSLDALALTPFNILVIPPRTWPAGPARSEVVGARPCTFRASGCVGPRGSATSQPEER